MKQLKAEWPEGTLTILHVIVTKSTSSALCIVSPFSTLTLIYLTPNLAIVFSYMKKEPKISLGTGQKQVGPTVNGVYTSVHTFTCK